MSRTARAFSFINRKFARQRGFSSFFYKQTKQLPVFKKKITMWSSLVGGTLLSSLGIASCAIAEKDEVRVDPQIWKKIWPTLEIAVGKYKEGLTLPQRTWFVGKDQRQNDQELDAILDDAVQILKLSKDLSSPRQEIERLKERIHAGNAQIAELRRERVTARDAPFLGFIDRLPTGWTKDAYDKDIKNKQAIVEAYQQDIAAIKAEYGAGLKQIGLQVSPEAVDALLESVSGPDLINMGIVFHNVKGITVELEKLTNKSGESLEIAEKYYGMYVVLLKVLNRMQRKFVEDVEQNYTPKLNQFAREAQNTLEEAKKLKAKAVAKKDDPSVKVLENNIHSNDVTATVAKEYTKYLAEQKSSVIDKNKLLQHDIDIAANTYKTVGISRNVAALIHSGRQNFDALMNLTMPIIRVFENEEMQREFKSLTSRIRNSK